VPESFVDAVTLAGPPDEVAAGVVRLAREGVTQLMLYPLSPDGRIEVVIERFQGEVMPRVRAAGG
jgi:alkanesulfonate monooxygenase SsuD/methylene tetrahydromethanopterin reductase-like flavin-dependent oxidoreductase (luciferase family)